MIYKDYAIAEVSMALVPQAEFDGRFAKNFDVIVKNEKEYFDNETFLLFNMNIIGSYGVKKMYSLRGEKLIRNILDPFEHDIKNDVKLKRYRCNILLEWQYSSLLETEDVFYFGVISDNRLQGFCKYLVLNREHEYISEFVNE